VDARENRFQRLCAIVHWKLIGITMPARGYGYRKGLKAGGMSGKAKRGARTYGGYKKVPGAQRSASRFAAVRAGGARSMGARAMNAARFRAGPRQELKYLDSTLTNVLVDATMEVPTTAPTQTLVHIAQGAAANQRIGRSVVVKSVSGRIGFLLTPAAAATAAGTVYVFVVQDTQCNGASAGATDVFTTADAGTCLLNLFNAQRFKILKRLAVPLVPKAGITAQYNNDYKSVSFYKAVNIPVEYSSTGGDITEIRSNSIFLLAGVSGTASMDDIVTMNGNIRVRYSD